MRHSAWIENMNKARFDVGGTVKLHSLYVVRHWYQSWINASFAMSTFQLDYNPIEAFQSGTEIVFFFQNAFIMQRVPVCKSNWCQSRFLFFHSHFRSSLSWRQTRADLRSSLAPKRPVSGLDLTTLASHLTLSVCCEEKVALEVQPSNVISRLRCATCSFYSPWGRWRLKLRYLMLTLFKAWNKAAGEF